MVKTNELEPRESLNMSSKLYALIEWEDQYLSIICVDTICQPRKEITEYKAGEYIKAKFKGSIYRAIIAEISRKYSLPKMAAGNIVIFYYPSPLSKE